MQIIVDESTNQKKESGLLRITCKKRLHNQVFQCVKQDIKY